MGSFAATTNIGNTKVEGIDLKFDVKEKHEKTGIVGDGKGRVDASNTVGYTYISFL